MVSYEVPLHWGRDLPDLSYFVLYLDMCGLRATPIFSDSLFETSLDSFNSYSSLESLSQELSSQELSLQSSFTTPSNDRSKEKKRSKKNNLTKLKVLSLNCNSIRSQHKKGLFKTLIDSEKPHIILGSESKLDSSISNGEVFPCEYKIFRKDRISDNPGGGVFIAIHNTILATHQPKLDSNSEAIWVKLEFVKQKPLYLASVYRPPQEGALNELENSLLSLQSNGSCPRVILTGDFNVPQYQM